MSYQNREGQYIQSGSRDDRSAQAGCTETRLIAALRKTEKIQPNLGSHRGASSHRGGNGDRISKAGSRARERHSSRYRSTAKIESRKSKASQIEVFREELAINYWRVKRTMNNAQIKAVNQIYRPQIYKPQLKLPTQRAIDLQISL